MLWFYLSSLSVIQIILLINPYFHTFNWHLQGLIMQKEIQNHSFEAFFPKFRKLPLLRPRHVHETSKPDMLYVHLMYLRPHAIIGREAAPQPEGTE